MKKLVMGALALLVVGSLFVGPILAADEDAPRGRRMKGPRGDRGDRPNPKERLEKLVKALDLTPGQQEQFEQVMKTHHQAIQNWRKEHGEELKAAREAMKKARASKDREAIKAAREKFAEIFKTRKGLNENLLKQLGDVLNKEQLAKAKRMFRPHRRGPGERLAGALRRLGLDEKQQEQVKKIMSQARQDAKKAESREARRKIIKEAVESIKKNVLNEEQTKKFTEMQKRFRKHGRRRPFAGLDLTEDQQAKVKAIMKEAREKAQSAEGKDEKRTIIRNAFKKVHDEVLTDEQKTKAKARREEFMKRRGERSDRRGGRDGRRRERKERPGGE